MPTRQTGQDQYLAPDHFDEWWYEFLHSFHKEALPPLDTTLAHRTGVILWAPQTAAFDLFDMTYFRDAYCRAVNDNGGHQYRPSDRPWYFSD